MNRDRSVGGVVALDSADGVPGGGGLRRLGIGGGPMGCFDGGVLDLGSSSSSCFMRRGRWDLSCASRCGGGAAPRGSSCDGWERELVEDLPSCDCVQC